ncbi:hypothetical protein D3C77_671060 [compost metagenome]
MEAASAKAAIDSIRLMGSVSGSGEPAQTKGREWARIEENYPDYFQVKITGVVPGSLFFFY